MIDKAYRFCLFLIYSSLFYKQINVYLKYKFLFLINLHKKHYLIQLNHILISNLITASKPELATLSDPACGLLSFFRVPPR